MYCVAYYATRVLTNHWITWLCTWKEKKRRGEKSWGVENSKKKTPRGEGSLSFLQISEVSNGHRLPFVITRVRFFLWRGFVLPVLLIVSFADFAYAIQIRFKWYFFFPLWIYFNFIFILMCTIFFCFTTFTIDILISICFGFLFIFKSFLLRDERIFLLELGLIWKWWFLEMNYFLNFT